MNKRTQDIFKQSFRFVSCIWTFSDTKWSGLMLFSQTVPSSWRRPTSSFELTRIKFPSSQRLGGNRYGATGILENWRAAVCLGDATRGGTKCCGWWRSWRCCFINSGSTSNLQLAWLNTETRHIKPARSTSWLNRRQPPPSRKDIRPESCRRKRRRQITDSWRETWKEQIEREKGGEDEEERRKVPDTESGAGEEPLIDQSHEETLLINFTRFLQRCRDLIADPRPPPTLRHNKAALCLCSSWLETGGLSLHFQIKSVGKKRICRLRLSERLRSSRKERLRVRISMHPQCGFSLSSWQTAASKRLKGGNQTGNTCFYISEEFN